MVSNPFWIWNHVAHGDLPAEEAFARFDALIAAIADRFAVASICGFAATTVRGDARHARGGPWPD